MNQSVNETTLKPDARRRLLDASEWLFDQQGFRQTTIQEIADRADVSPGLIYHYFRSKQDILTAIYDDKMQDLLNRLQGNSGLSCETDGIREAMVIMTEQLTELPFDLVCQNISPKNGHMIPGPKLVKYMKEAVEKAQENHELTNQYTSDRIVRDIITASMGVILQWCSAGGNYDVIAEQRRFMRLFLHGLRPD